MDANTEVMTDEERQAMRLLRAYWGRGYQTVESLVGKGKPTSLYNGLGVFFGKMFKTRHGYKVYVGGWKETYPGYYQALLAAIYQDLKVQGKYREEEINV